MLVGVMLVGSLLSAFEPGEGSQGPSAEIRKTYDEERAKVGRDAEAHVRLALWCEANGLRAEREKHLALAVIHEPSNAMARGLLGLASYDGRWQRPDDLARKIQSDADRAATTAQYLEKRAKTPQTADEQWKLAMWCEENGLKAESIAHLHGVLRADPSREAAWKRLGFKKVQGRWISEEQLAAAKEEAALQKQADRQWKPRLEALRKALDSSDEAKRGKARDELAEIRDARAVPSVWGVFTSGKAEKHQAAAVQLFGQIDCADASRALAMLAVGGETPEIRRTATETLKRRDVREFAAMLVAMVREPIKYEVKPVGGQGESGSIAIEGKERNVKRIYTPPPVALPDIYPGDRITYDESGQPILLRAFLTNDSGPLSGAPTMSPGFPSPSGTAPPAADRRHPNSSPSVQTLPTPRGPTDRPGGGGPMGANWRESVTATWVGMPLGAFLAQKNLAEMSARRKLETDISEIESYNASARELNDRVLPVLVQVAGKDHGPVPASWSRWFVDQLGMSVQPQKSANTTTVVENVPIDFQPQPVTASPVILGQATVAVQYHHSCFAAGTPVRTLNGLRPIETIQEGDVILTQDTHKGGLTYQPVVRVYKNPPNATLRIATGDDAIVATPIHRFWKAGQGWVMARDLKAGDVLRTVGGSATITSVDEERVQPVYNLQVAENADFFVGRVSALVHDNSLPDLRQAPFDAGLASRK